MTKKMPDKASHVHKGFVKTIIPALAVIICLWLLCSLSHYAISKDQKPCFDFTMGQSHFKFSTQEGGCK